MHFRLCLLTKSSFWFVYSMRRYPTISESSIAVSCIFQFCSQFWHYNKWMFTKNVCSLYISDVIINWMMEVYLIIEHEKNPNFIELQRKLSSIYFSDYLSDFLLNTGGSLFYPFSPVNQVVRIACLSEFIENWLAEAWIEKRIWPRSIQAKTDKTSHYFSLWLDSDLIPRLLENFENWKNFIVILLNVKYDAYRPTFFLEKSDF